ncbi:hypothetical protein HHE06_09050 [Helicobacter heilmannii]|uniref:Uncharacterized protein n=1 Tax=Helicobacter heilmannii TaxID=35817 RepID=A0A0K2XDQ0_HELHE|nr:hypothetical protein BN341_13540 [Helicobacter heilmannii ASB1.4]CRF45430.1 hypothetical protein HHE014_03930 [Helicobacter heilmannii]CRF51046.1 hypothetical protein HHE06_09050 [Helicobacter heilmannii]CRI34827.1 hypothetical protein HHE01_06280 [Helicobacter heilmannii]
MRPRLEWSWNLSRPCSQNKLLISKNYPTGTKGELSFRAF